MFLVEQETWADNNDVCCSEAEYRLKTLTFSYKSGLCTDQCWRVGIYVFRRKIVVKCFIVGKVRARRVSPRGQSFPYSLELCVCMWRETNYKETISVWFSTSHLAVTRMCHSFIFYASSELTSDDVFQTDWCTVPESIFSSLSNHFGETFVRTL